jgi:hypothetical protein
LSIGFSILKLARASSPKIDLAYRVAAMNPQSPNIAFKIKHVYKIEDFDSES